MQPDLITSDARWAVRSAARGWLKAGAISREERAAIEARWADERRRPGWPFRILLFGFTWFLAFAVFGFAVLLFEPRGRAPFALLVVLGAASALACAILLTRGRLRNAGAEEASALFAVGAVAVGLPELLGASIGDDLWVVGALGLAALLSGAVTLIWGMPAFGGLAALATFALLARFPGARLWWALAGVGVGYLLQRVRQSPTLPRAYRSAASWALAVVLVALFSVVFPAALEHGLIEILGGRFPDARPLTGWTLAGAELLTLAGALALAGYGARRRQRLLLDLGLGLSALALTELAHRYAVGPAWLVLVIGGGLAISFALAVRRWLEAGREAERHGLTARPPLLAERGAALTEIAATLAALSPPAAQPPQPADFAGAGGEFGGGGASDRW